jgi:hypothetical protein
MRLKENEQGQAIFDMDGRDEDLFFLSNGHISPVFYSVLARARAPHNRRAPAGRSGGLGVIGSGYVGSLWCGPRQAPEWRR